MGPYQWGYNLMDRLLGQKAMVENAYAKGYKEGYERGRKEARKIGYEEAIAQRKATQTRISEYERGKTEGIALGITMGIAQERERQTRQRPRQIDA